MDTLIEGFMILKSAMAEPDLVKVYLHYLCIPEMIRRKRVHEKLRVVPFIMDFWHERIKAFADDDTVGLFIKGLEIDRFKRFLIDRASVWDTSAGSIVAPFEGRISLA